MLWPSRCRYTPINRKRLGYGHVKNYGLVLTCVTQARAYHASMQLSRISGRMTAHYQCSVSRCLHPASLLAELFNLNHRVSRSSCHRRRHDAS